MPRTLFLCEDSSSDSNDSNLINETKNLCTILANNTEKLSFVLYGSFNQKGGITSQIVQQFINNSQQLNIVFRTSKDISNYSLFFPLERQSRPSSCTTSTHKEDTSGTNKWKLKYRVVTPPSQVTEKTVVNPKNNINKLYHCDGNFISYIYRNYDSVILYHGGNELNYMLSSLSCVQNNDEDSKLKNIILFNRNHRLDNLLNLYSNYEDEGLSTLSNLVKVVDTKEDILDIVTKSCIQNNYDDEKYIK